MQPNTTGRFPNGLLQRYASRCVARGMNLAHSRREALLSQQDNSASLQEHRRRLTWSISDYATKIAALQDEDDPASIERVRAALRPIDAIREQQAHRQDG